MSRSSRLRSTEAFSTISDSKVSQVGIAGLAVVSTILHRIVISGLIASNKSSIWSVYETSNIGKGVGVVVESDGGIFVVVGGESPRASASFTGVARAGSVTFAVWLRRGVGTTVALL